MRVMLKATFKMHEAIMDTSERKIRDKRIAGAGA
jgi:hypothetical protein